ncbi:TPA: hypothetical protein ACKFHZ_001918 [Burkholderia multivorans]
MTIQNDFLPFAVGAGANVLTQSAYAALTALGTGYQAGTAQSAACNKTWRQSSIMAAVISQFIVAQTGQPAIDDGTTATLLVNFTAAVTAAAQAAAPGRLLNVQKFTSSGTYTPTPGTTTIIVEVLGGGGGGGGSAATSSTQAAAGGCGASGAYAKSRFTSGFAAGIAVTVGAAGVAGAAGSGGGTGGTTYFGSLVAAPGGTGGAGGIALAVSGGTGSGVCSAPNPPGNLVSYAGSSVMQSIIINPGVAFTAAGGSSIYGNGGIPSGVTGPGFSGSGYGAAGAGGVSLANASAQVGGAGSQGVAIVWEYA